MGKLNEQTTSTAVVTTEKPQSERFTEAVVKEFTTTSGGVAISESQKRLIANYFIKLNLTLQLAEQKRLAKDEKYREQLPYDWKNIDIAKLSLDVMAFAKVGLDPTLPNHLSLIPFKNGATGKYDIVFLVGYRGCELKAKKYGIDMPDDVVIELVYSTDNFKQIKRDVNNAVEGYTFEVTNDFNRGDLVGGFYYHKYFKTPEKNRLRVFSKTEIEKRKPKHASTEFWGGEKAVWEGNKKTDKTEAVDGWYAEMCYKTLYRAAYDAITIDAEKIDEALFNVMQKDKEAMYGKEIEAEKVDIKEPEINGQKIGFDSPIKIHPVKDEPEVANGDEKANVKAEINPGF